MMTDKRGVSPAKGKYLFKIIMTKSKTLGTNTSQVEITNISKHGIWLLTGDRELFMSYEDFPWFQDAKVKEILKVNEPTPGHFYWPDLDVDLERESIEYPERFPNIAK